MGISKALGYVIFSAVLVISTLAVGTFLFGILIKRRIELQYVKSEDRFLWLKNALVLLLPAEFIRMIACTLTLGRINSTGRLSYLASFIYEFTYLRLTDRSKAVRGMGEIIPMDVLAYLLCYLVYFALYFAPILLTYKRRWDRCGAEKEDLEYVRGTYHEDSNRRFY